VHADGAEDRAEDRPAPLYQCWRFSTLRVLTSMSVVRSSWTFICATTVVLNESSFPSMRPSRLKMSAMWVGTVMAFKSSLSSPWPSGEEIISLSSLPNASVQMLGVLLIDRHEEAIVSIGKVSQDAVNEAILQRSGAAILEVQNGAHPLQRRR
jgi:hypothetical protein